MEGNNHRCNAALKSSAGATLPLKSSSFSVNTLSLFKIPHPASAAALSQRIISDNVIIQLQANYPKLGSRCLRACNYL